MTTLTLLTRIYNTHQLKQMDRVLADLFGDLSVEATLTGTQANRWVQLEVSGEDEEVAKNLLEREEGFCPVRVEGVKKFAALKGYATGVEQSKEELLVDVGVFQPRTVNAAVPLKRLQSQLAEGKDLSLKQMCEVWGISDNVPLDLKILEVNGDKTTMEAELQAQQVRRYLSWKESLLDRLLVLGAPLYEVNMAIDQAGLRRDIIDVEPLGMFEFALVCKLGTDAAGLIGSLGRRIRKARFTVFNSKL